MISVILGLILGFCINYLIVEYFLHTEFLKSNNGPIIILQYSINMISILIVFIIVRYTVLKKTISPLTSQINWLKETNLYTEIPNFESSGIIEFDEMNTCLKELSKTIIETYISQKQYSENLSHELLTPIAIIRSKVELLLQSQKLNKNELEAIDTIMTTLTRLSNLNKGLILLAKIDNNQFIDKEEINLNEIIIEALENFEDQIRVKNLTIRVKQNENIIISTNINLIRILISNLIKNSIFHNIEGGYLIISIEGASVIIENSGEENKSDTKFMFNRFVSSGNSSYSLGLGLSIVKKICDELDFQIEYTNEKKVHIVSLLFSKD